MTPRIHITGGLGFIGSNLVRWLNARGITPFIYDRLTGEKWRNVAGLRFVLREVGALWERGNIGDTLVHLGANVDTTEPFNNELWLNNVELSRLHFSHFSAGRVIYASSAAVYGSEERDFTPRVYGPKPLNAYGFTKLSLDQAVFGESPVVSPAHVYGLRLFNVYGRNEGLKGEMASVVHKALKRDGNDPYGIYTEFTHRNGGYSRMSPNDKPHWALFASERPDVPNGEQARDFVHVDDVCAVIGHFALSETAPTRGVYNVGTGVARSFNDLVRIIDPNLPIEYRPMPAVLKGAYQYHTKADLTTLRVIAQYNAPFATLKEGIAKTRSAASGTVGAANIS